MQKLWCTGFKAFKTIVENNNWTNGVPDNIAIISINCGDGIRRPSESHLCAGDNVLNLDFDDVDPISLGLSENSETHLGHNEHGDPVTITHFTGKQADIAVKFIEQHQDKDFFIHCSAGVSRSQAFVKYIQTVYFERQWETNPGNPCQHPNMFVYQKLMKKHRGE